MTDNNKDTISQLRLMLAYFLGEASSKKRNIHMWIIPIMRDISDNVCNINGIIVSP
jgi:hypothetical protein